MMFTRDSEEARAHGEVTEGRHNVPVSHEVIAAAASYEAAKAYVHHCQTIGKPVSHEKATELMAAFAGVFVDRFAETKGLDEVQKMEAKHEAHKRTNEALRRSGEY